MAITTDYRISDDDKHLAALAVSKSYDEGGEDIVTLSQDGVDIEISREMALDLIAVLGKLMN